MSRRNVVPMESSLRNIEHARVLFVMSSALVDAGSRKERCDAHLRHPSLADASPMPVWLLSAGTDLVYDLRLDQASSQRFYADVAAFSARTVAEIERRASRALDGYSRYVTENLLESPRTRGEYGLELLTVGMALRLYGVLATETPGWVVAVCRELFRLRRRSTRMKPAIDWIRAGIFQLFLRRHLRSSALAGAGVFAHFDGANATSLAALPQVIKWMQATGEFEQESQAHGQLDELSARAFPNRG